MNKLETITQLLVNELADFEKNVQQLLEEFGRRETERREHYLNRLERNLQQAKIYPKWAVITFMVFFGISLSTVFYAYNLKSVMENEKNEAFLQGERKGIMHLEQFLNETPSATKLYDEWRIDKSQK